MFEQQQQHSEENVFTFFTFRDPRFYYRDIWLGLNGKQMNNQMTFSILFLSIRQWLGNVIAAADGAMLLLWGKHMQRDYNELLVIDERS